MENTQKPFTLSDAHLHLQDKRYAGKLDVLLGRAREAGIKTMICNGCCEDDWTDVAKIAQNDQGIIPCFGVHPWYVNTLSESWTQKLTDFLKSMPSGVGEIGLDKWINGYDIEKQKDVFRKQLVIAKELGRAVVIHCLKAWEPLVEILKSEDELPDGIMIHAFGGSTETMRQLLPLGCYYSFGGSLLFENSKKTRDAFLCVPLDRILIETDSPDILPPKKFRYFEMQDENGKIVNEPANLSRIISGLAEIRGIRTEELAKINNENLKRLFRGIIN